MFTENDKQILLDHANTIESGLIRVAEAIPDRQDLTALTEAIYCASERIERGLTLIAIAIEKHLD